MQDFLKNVVVLVIANAVGLAVASLVLGPGFRLSLSYFVLAVLIFTAVAAGAAPLLKRASDKWVPQLTGALSLLAVLVGLIVTQLILPGKVISGLSSWVTAPLIVWLVSLVGQVLLPRWLFGKTPPAADK